MAKTIAIAIQKGGCAKTTTTITLGSCLAEKGYKVLLVDFDPQGNLSRGCNVEDAEYTIYNVLKEEYIEKRSTNKKGISAAILEKPENCGFDVVPANICLAGGEGEFSDVSRTYLLKNVLKPVKEKYDFILVDCPPSLGILTLNAFTASDFVVIPMEATNYALQGLEQLYDTIVSAKEYCNNPGLKVLGVLITRIPSRTNAAKFALMDIKEKADELEIPVFKTMIERAVVFTEAEYLKMPLIAHDPNCNSMKQYTEFCDELLEEVQKNE